MVVSARVPKRLEDAAGLFVTLHPLRTLRHRGVAYRIRLRLGCLLARLLRHRPLLDTDQRFAVGAVEDVHPTGAAGFGKRLAGLAVVDRIEQHDWARRTVVPDVLSHLLEMPGILAGFGVKRDNRCTEQVVGKE